MEFKEQIQRILENVPRVYEAGRGSVNNDFANALRGNVSGEAAVVLPDVSPIEHNIKVKVSSKNVIPLPTTGEYAKDGVSFTHNANGTIFIKGIAEKDVFYVFSQNPNISIEGAYTSSGGWMSENNRQHYVVISIGSTNGSLNSTDVARLYEVPKGTKITQVALWLPSGTDLGEGVTVYPLLERGTTATHYTQPVADIKAVKVMAQGKNLLPYPFYNTTKTANGITFTDNGDGSITINGTAEANASFHLYHYQLFGEFYVNSHKMILSGIAKNAYNNGYSIQASIEKDGVSKTVSNTGDGLILEYGTSIKSIYINVRSGFTLNNVIVKPQLEIDTTATEHEPYIEPTEYPVNKDGTVTGVASISPTTTLLTDTAGTIIDAEYNIDTNRAFAKLQQAIISLGGNV